MNELDATTYPAWVQQIAEAEAGGNAVPGPPRSYPGYPRVPLPRSRTRWFPSLDSVLRKRCSPEALSNEQPSLPALARLLELAHGVTGAEGRGSVPSAGGLQGLELYIAVLSPGWLPEGVYHFDRVAHALSELEQGIARPEWERHVPVLSRVSGGSLLWILVGDAERVCAKYGDRAVRFLLLEAGHLMQNLCLVSASLGMGTRPLGGYCERALARRLRLLDRDEVLYVGVCGKARASASSS